MIYHIYWGTSGNSGLYLDAIYNVLKDCGYTQKAFVNYYYPFDYGEKVFFKRGDIAFGKKGRIRKLFQLLEVIKGYAIILVSSKKDKPELINYSHAGHSYFFVPLYLKFLKKLSGAKLMITCHDVFPLGGAYSEMKYRKRIFDLAEYLLVHNDNSRKELIDSFKADDSKIVEHLFPIMDLSRLPKAKKDFLPVDFLFIGHLRKNKGVQLLLDSWLEFHKIVPSASLRICGAPTNDIKIDELSLKESNVELNLHFIADDDYPAYIESARYVILPYLIGTNSGIISTVLSLGAGVIASDLPMFLENPLLDAADLFKCGDSESLVRKMHEKYAQKTSLCNNQKYDDYRQRFSEGVINVYSSILHYP